MAEEKIGARIKVARLAAGHPTLARGAQAARMALPSLADYEAGRRIPGAKALRTICRRFKVSADWLLGLPKGQK